MPVLVKHIIFLVASFSLILLSFQLLVLPNFDDEWRAIIMRAEIVTLMECLMGICSYMLWKTLKPLPNMLSTQVQQDMDYGDAEDQKPLSNFNRRPLRKHSTNEIKRTSSSRSKQLLLWKAFLLLFVLMSHFSFLTNIFFYGAEPDWFSFLAYLCFGTLIQFNTGLLIIKCVSVMLRYTRIYITGNISSKPKGLSQKFTTSFALLYMLCFSSLGLFTAAQLPTVKNVSIPLLNLPPNLHKFRIIQLSDIHLGPTVGRTRLQKVVDIVNTQNADVVVITGDLVDGSVRQLKEATSPLRLIHSKYGAMFSTGNHEYYTGDVDNWFRHLQSLGLKVLHNSNVKVPPNSQHQICIAGTDDLQADLFGYGKHSFNVTQAVKGCDRKQPTILLAHQPRAARRALDADVGIDIVLSGHTHGGQMFPINIAVYLFEPLYRGLYQYKGGHVYVSTGTFYWGIPMRIGTTMEITVITLLPSS